MKTLKILTVLAIILAISAFAVFWWPQHKMEKDLAQLDESKLKAETLRENFPEAKGAILIYATDAHLVSKTYQNIFFELKESSTKNGYDFFIINPHLVERFKNFLSEEEKASAEIDLFTKQNQALLNTPISAPIVYVIKKTDEFYQIKAVASLDMPQNHEYFFDVAFKTNAFYTKSTFH